MDWIDWLKTIGGIIYLASAAILAASFGIVLYRTWSLFDRDIHRNDR